MNEPVRVAVTGAAGQIGYSLLFRIASGEHARPRPAGDPAAARDHAGPRRAARACAWSSRTAPSRCCTAWSRPTTPTWRSATSTSRCSSVPCPARKGMERSDLLERQRWHLQAAGRGAVPIGEARREGAGGRQPGQHQLPHRAAEREGSRPAAVHGHDPARPQPGRRPARGQGRRAHHRHHAHDDLGQPLRHAVPRPLPRRGQRQARRSSRRRRPGLARERLHPDRAAARRGDHQGPRAVVRRVGGQRRRRPRAHVGAGTADGDWVSMAIVSDGSYGVAEGLISSFPCTCSGRRRTRSSRASTSTTSAAAASTRASPSSARSATPSRNSA